MVEQNNFQSMHRQDITNEVRDVGRCVKCKYIYIYIYIYIHMYKILITIRKNQCRDFLTCVAVPIWTWMGSVVHTSSEPMQHAQLHETAYLVFELRMSSPDGAVKHKRSKWPSSAAKVGATLITATTVARTLMLNPLASQSHVE